MDDMKWFFGFILIIGMLWISSRFKKDAPEPEALPSSPVPAVTAPTGSPTAPQQSGNNPPAGTIISQSTAPVPDPNLSPLKGKLFIYSAQLYGPVEQEYILIQASSANTDSIPLTGLSVRSGETFNSQTISKGLSLMYPGSVSEGETIMLRPGGYAYLLSGRSPIPLTTGPITNSGGFQPNKCTGYFEQGLDFYPALSIECPSPTSEPLPQAPNRLSDACYDYMASLPRCTLPPGTIPSYLLADGNCQAHLFNKINYGQCVAYHKNEPDFFKNEWRIYFGRGSKLWRDRRETVELLDVNGKVIDRKSY